MSGTSAARPSPIPPLQQRLVTFARELPQRFGEQDFWIIQAAVLAVTAGHLAMELWIHQFGQDLPAALYRIPVILYLVPISHASLRYGMEAAVLTGLWSAALTLPNLLIWHRADFAWLELLYVAVVMIAGIVISVPVERERLQRRRAEATIQRQGLLIDIARLTLTADLPTTLDEALRRLLDVLDLEAVGVALADPTVPASTGVTMIACHPPSGPAREALTAALHERRPSGGPSDDGDLVTAPVTGDLPGSGPQGRVDGVLAARTLRARGFGEEDHRLLAGVASHVAVAIAHERLIESERTRLRSYAMAMTRAQEEERKRIARELHDEASQNLVVIRREIAALTASLGDDPVAAELGALGDLAGQTVACLRRFSRDLRPPTLDELGVSSALAQLVAQVRERSLLAVDLRIEGVYRRLPTESELTVFRIGQAALHNVERHAAAETVDVELAFEPGRVRLTVTDDGCGFGLPSSLDELAAAGKLGLIGMRERAQLAGGSLQIRSRPGAGTRVLLDLPG